MQNFLQVRKFYFSDPQLDGGITPSSGVFDISTKMFTWQFFGVFKFGFHIMTNFHYII